MASQSRFRSFVLALAAVALGSSLADVGARAPQAQQRPAQPASDRHLPVQRRPRHGERGRSRQERQHRPRPDARRLHHHRGRPAADDLHVRLRGDRDGGGGGRAGRDSDDSRQRRSGRCRARGRTGGGAADDRHARPPRDRAVLRPQLDAAGGRPAVGGLRARLRREAPHAVRRDRHRDALDDAPGGAGLHGRPRPAAPDDRSDERRGGDGVRGGGGCRSRPTTRPRRSRPTMPSSRCSTPTAGCRPSRR